MIDPQHISKLNRLYPRLSQRGPLPTVDIVAGHLAVGLMLDLGGQSRDVTRQDLIDWGTTLEELLPVAIDNLRRRSEHDGWYPVETTPGLRIYSALDGEASSRLMLLGELLQPTPMGGMLVAVPRRNQLLVVALENMDCLESLRVLAAAPEVPTASASQRISDQLFWYDGEAWHIMPVTRTREEIRIQPTREFLAALDRLAAMGMFAQAAEA